MNRSLPAEWMPLDASDEGQTSLFLLALLARAIFTYNIRDFSVLGKRYPRHAGIVLARQKSLSLNAKTINKRLITALDRVLRETNADEWIGQTRWLRFNYDQNEPWRR
jgi:hypothetical protein